MSVKYLTKPLFILLITSAATASWFMDLYGTIIDLDIIRNAAETTGSEAGHPMTAGFLIHMTVFAFVPSLLIALVRIRHLPIAQKVLWNLAVILPCLADFAALRSLASSRPTSWPLEGNTVPTATSHTARLISQGAPDIATSAPSASAAASRSTIFSCSASVNFSLPVQISMSV